MNHNICYKNKTISGFLKQVREGELEVPIKFISKRLGEDFKYFSTPKLESLQLHSQRVDDALKGAFASVTVIHVRLGSVATQVTLDGTSTEIINVTFHYDRCQRVVKGWRVRISVRKEGGRLHISP